MNEFLILWLALAAAVPLIGAVLVTFIRDARRKWYCGWISSGISLLATLAVCYQFDRTDGSIVTGPALSTSWMQGPIWRVDAFNVPLLSLAAAIHFFVVLTTPASERSRFPFGLTLLSQTLVMGLLSCQSPPWMICLLAAQSLLPLVELRQNKQVWQFFLVHQVLSLLLVVFGLWLINPEALGGGRSISGILVLTSGLLIRCGCFPVHCWMVDLFGRTSFGTALLYLLPMVGVYLLVRWVLPIAPEWILHWAALLSLATAIYASGMSLVQTCTRRFFCYLLISNTSLVIAGLEIANVVGVTGALSLWLSANISLAAFGIVLRGLEARVGRMSLDRFHGLYGQMPLIAAFFLLASLGSIGFPGTAGFVGAELLIEGMINVYSYFGMAVVFVMTLNGIGVLKVYFRLFTGASAPASISMQPRWYEQIAISVFTLLILVGGFYPQPGISKRHQAALEMIRQRALISGLDGDTNANEVHQSVNFNHDNEDNKL